MKTTRWRLVLVGLAVAGVAGCGGTSEKAGHSVQIGSGASASPSPYDTDPSTTPEPFDEPTLPLPVNQPTTIAPAPLADPPTGATKVSLSSSDISAIVSAFEQFTSFNANCTLHPVSGTLKAARVTATGVTWAFGQFNPPLDCTVGTPDGQENLLQSRIFTPFPPRDAGIFEKPSGGTWTMNDYETNPFPCPADTVDRTPGRLSPYVPLNVLKAVGVSYASATGCLHPIALLQP